MQFTVLYISKIESANFLKGAVFKEKKELNTLDI